MKKGISKEMLEEKVLDLGEYIVKTGSTVRETAAHFGIPKSTVHYDVTKLLPEIDPVLYDKVLDVLGMNSMDRARRAGNATKKMYEEKRRKDNAL